jgi:hypothetical protein
MSRHELPNRSVRPQARNQNVNKKEDGETLRSLKITIRIWLPGRFRKTSVSRCRYLRKRSGRSRLRMKTFRAHRSRDHLVSKFLPITTSPFCAGYYMTAMLDAPDCVRLGINSTVRDSRRLADAPGPGEMPFIEQRLNISRGMRARFEVRPGHRRRAVVHLITDPIA